LPIYNIYLNYIYTFSFFKKILVLLKTLSDKELSSIKLFSQMLPDKNMWLLNRLFISTNYYICFAETNENYAWFC